MHLFYIILLPFQINLNFQLQADLIQISRPQKQHFTTRFVAHGVAARVMSTRVITQRPRS